VSDRIDPDGDYNDGNTRVVLYSVNGLRGRGGDRRHASDRCGFDQPWAAA
jgi:hypothetical protein